MSLLSMIVRTMIIIISCISNTNEVKSKVLVVRRNEDPLCEYDNPDLLMGAFPTLFPYGVGGLEDENNADRMPFAEHVKMLLQSSDHKFRHHGSFLYLT